MPAPLRNFFCHLFALMLLLETRAFAGDVVITKLTLPTDGKTGFTLLDPTKTRAQFINYLPESRQVTNANLMNGSGVALGDFDGDGLCDIYFCSLAGSNVLYKNLGNWTFRDVTAESGAACPGQNSTGAVFADIDGDGDLDLLVTSLGGPNACLFNDGKGHFVNRTAEAGLLSQWGSCSMALADIDGNGTLDLYVCNYGATSILRSGGNVSVTTNAKGEQVVTGRNSKRLKIVNGVITEIGEPDAFYLNDGAGHFTPVAWSQTFVDELGKPLADAPWDQGLSVIIRDLNGDGSPDIYVCNDFATPDRIWLNDGHGKFRAAPHSMIAKTSYLSMAVDIADIDRDGDDDILTVDMLSRIHSKRMTQVPIAESAWYLPGDFTARAQTRRNVLLLNNGHGTFTETGNYSGLAASDWSWSCIFVDVDLDGWEDVLVTNGYEHDMDDTDARLQQEKLGPQSFAASRRSLLKFPKLSAPNYAFRNRRDGRFDEVGAQWNFNSTSICNGMALADLDNDGDLDVVINCMNSPALIYRNDSTAPRVAVRLSGKAPNTQGIGARITVSGGPVTQSQVMIAGGRYVSGDQAERVFAAGTNLMSIRVDWPNGMRSETSNIPPNSRCVISEDSAIQAAKLEKREPFPWFENVSSNLNRLHRQADYNDFARQPSLPHKLSQTGPPIAIKDLNGDGFDDVIIGAGKSGRGAVLISDHGKFHEETPAVWSQPATANDNAIVAFSTTEKTTTVLRAESNYEQSGSDSIIHVYEVAENRWRETQILKMPASTISALVVADVDANGALDLFVAGRCIPGEYPREASSYLFRNNGERFELDSAASKIFQNIGLVTGAIFSDLNADGFPDLVLSVEWSSIRIFQNDHGAFKELPAPSKSGLWTFVTTGDFDSDGLPDIFAGNWGLNSTYAARLTEQVALYHGDLNQDGHEAMLEAYKDGAKFVPLHSLLENSKTLPWLTFASHAAYSVLSAEEVLGDRLKISRRLQTDSLASTLLLNRGDHFDPAELPAEAQFSPATGAIVADFDGDGFEDIFIAQNFLDVRPGQEPLDAGRGLLLRGNGAGKFEASVLDITGQQTSPAVLDCNNDGKADLIVGINSGATQLLRNNRAAPGLRLKLHGLKGNFGAIGATVRLQFGDHLGPAREIRCAGGPIGQESPTQIFSNAKESTGVRVVWPGGKRVDYPISPKATLITIDIEKGVIP